jgi:shikimate dehydrogenase
MKACLIGRGISYSYSPLIHKGFNEEIDYQIVDLSTDEEFVNFMKSNEYDFFNVTIPYKEQVQPYLDEIDESAKTIGAVNLVVRRENKLIGYNTDFYGIKSAFELNGISLKDKVVMILGSGGTYKTAKAVCKKAGVKKLISVSRSSKPGFITYEHVRYQNDVEIIINCTPVGSDPHIYDKNIDLRPFSKLEAVLDMIYHPMRTNFIKQAERLHKVALNGLIPLVYQGGKAQEIALGKEIALSTYLKVLRLMRRETSAITLIGMPGSGKSTIGKALANKLGYKFIDTDSLIEKKEGMTIKEIFEKKGEPYFRKKEEEVSRKLVDSKKLVIATGGGMVINPRIMANLSYNSTLVYLYTNDEIDLYNGKRPLLKNKEDYYRLLKERKPLYQKYSDISILKGYDEIDEVVERIIEKL